MGSVEVTRLLLEHGANIDAENNMGDTPFLVALEAEHHEMVEFLWGYGFLCMYLLWIISLSDLSNRTHVLQLCLQKFLLTALPICESASEPFAAANPYYCNKWRTSRFSESAVNVCDIFFPIS